jgi:hypothetical protein
MVVESYIRLRLVEIINKEDTIFSQDVHLNSYMFRLNGSTQRRHKYYGQISRKRFTLLNIFYSYH